jgi:hypothetical protein
MLYPYSGKLRISGKGGRRNSLGYRGEEFDPDAPVKLFVCGCSYTLGTGLELEEMWSVLFRQKLAKHRELPESSVNLMNFSEGGASNDYIARTLIAQASRVRPDVMIAGFTHLNRFELLDESSSADFGAWTLRAENQDAPDRSEIQKRGDFIFLGTDEIQEKIRMIRNVLLLQYYCQSRDIPFLFLFFEMLQREDLPDALSVPTTQPLYEQIDLDLLVPMERATKVDRASDGSHPGPRSQQLIAEAAWKTYLARYAQVHA